MSAVRTDGVGTLWTALLGAASNTIGWLLASSADSKGPFGFWVIELGRGDSFLISRAGPPDSGGGGSLEGEADITVKQNWRGDSGSGQ